MLFEDQYKVCVSQALHILKMSHAKTNAVKIQKPFNKPSFYERDCVLKDGLVELIIYPCSLVMPQTMALIRNASEAILPAPIKSFSGHENTAVSFCTDLFHAYLAAVRLH